MTRRQYLVRLGGKQAVIRLDRALWTRHDPQDPRDGGLATGVAKGWVSVELLLVAEGSLPAKRQRAKPRRPCPLA
jgi:hypothetical protein